MNQSLVPTIELCQKMKELGWKKETTFYWRVEIDDGEEYPEVWFGDFEERLGLEKITSPTLQEILEELPNYVSVVSCGGGRFGERANYLAIENVHSRELWVKNPDRSVGINWEEFRDRNPVNACAELWIYLKENGLLEEKI